MPLSPSATRELLVRLGHLPKRALGQNFLIDGNIVQKSVALAEVGPRDHIVEVGPGLGTLSRALLETGAHLWAVEHDKTLAAYLAETLKSEFGDHFHLQPGDAMEFPRAALPVEFTPSFKVVANLPYAISTPWLDAILQGPLPSRLVLMLQLEAAQRYTAKPGTKQFGAISVFLQAAYDVAPGHKVSPNCFHPRPEVDSYLLNLVRKPAPFVFPSATKQIIRAIFQQRRKQIGSLLRSHLPDRGEVWLNAIAPLGVTPQTRAEAIPLEAWKSLSVTGNSFSLNQSHPS